MKRVALKEVFRRVLEARFPWEKFPSAGREKLKGTPEPGGTPGSKLGFKKVGEQQKFLEFDDGRYLAEDDNPFVNSECMSGDCHSYSLFDDSGNEVSGFYVVTGFGMGGDEYAIYDSPLDHSGGSSIPYHGFDKYSKAVVEKMKGKLHYSTGMLEYLVPEMQDDPEIDDFVSNLIRWGAEIDKSYPFDKYMSSDDMLVLSQFGKI